MSAFFEPRKDLLEIAKADDHKSLEKVHGDFAQFITNLTAGANFLHPSFVHAAPQYLFHVYRGKVLTDAIIALEAPSEGISRLKCLNPVAGFAAEKALLEKKNAKHVSEKLRLWDALSEGLQRKCEILYKNDCELLGYDFNS